MTLPAVNDAIDKTLLRRRLLGWYRKSQRQLPWRQDTPNPYHVLVSEAMLQQTQVATVVDYFNRFVTRWPTITDLAGASEAQVLKQWQGLGYYRRVRHLHLAAKQIVADFAGHVPSEVEQLLTLPGVGRYTAGAVASIAFGKSVPVVDGNVMRVLSRWYAITEPVDRKDVTALLWQLAGDLVPRGRSGGVVAGKPGGHSGAGGPGDFNQAMMELGALVCVPRKPACLTCPMAGLCLAHEQNIAEDLPVKRAKRKPLAVEHHVLAVCRAGKYLFEQRPSRGLWANMWQLVTSQEMGKAQSAPSQLAAWCKQRYGLMASRPKLVDQFVHLTTHRTITFYIWSATVTGGRLKARTGCWRRLNQLTELPLANPQRKAIQMLGVRCQ